MVIIECNKKWHFFLHYVLKYSFITNFKSVKD